MISQHYYASWFSGNAEAESIRGYLRLQDIDKIASTYRERKSQEKYDHVAPLDEIREKRLQPEHPARYVDTFEEGEPLDLQAVSNELKVPDEENAGSGWRDLGLLQAVGH